MAPPTTILSEPQQKQYGDEMVEYLHGMHILSELEVMIISVDGWSWALGWAQLGATAVSCLPLTDRAKVNLDVLESAIGGSVQFKQVVGTVRGVVCFHISSPLEPLLAEYVQSLPETTPILGTADLASQADVGSLMGDSGKLCGIGAWAD